MWPSKLKGYYCFLHHDNCNYKKCTLTLNGLNFWSLGLNDIRLVSFAYMCIIVILLYTPYLPYIGIDCILLTFHI